MVKIYRSGDKIENASPCIALGNFDGMHKGHMRIFSEAARAPSFGALLFEENTKIKKQITPIEEKIRILDEIGAAYAYVVDFDKNFKSQSLGEFADFLEKIGVGSVCVGYDYRCARGAAADAGALGGELLRRGIGITVCEPVTDGNEPIKSSLLRERIAAGEVARANELMYKPYRLCGKVVEGYRRGREIGFPTANIKYPENKLLPADGVYRAACVVDGVRYTAVLNIGKNPTFGLKSRSAEAHLIGYSGDLYGREIAVEIADRVRAEMRFGDIFELKKQIEKDIRLCKGE